MTTATAAAHAILAPGARVALVLGPGGLVGEAFHAGTLMALADHGWDPRDAAMMVGTSTGAVSTAALRAGLAPSDLHARIVGGVLSDAGQRILACGGGWPSFPPPSRSFARRPRRSGLWPALASHPWRLRPGTFSAAIAPLGAIDPSPIATAFNRIFQGAWPVTLRVCAMDLATGRRHVFAGAEAGADIGTAVSASVAVPGYFRPVVINGRSYVDGGCHSPLNADVISDVITDFDAVVASLPMGIGGLPGRGGVDLPGRLLNHVFGVGELGAARRAGVPVALFEPTSPELALMRWNAFDGSRLETIAYSAYSTVRSRLARSAPPAPHPRPAPSAASRRDLKPREPVGAETATLHHDDPAEGPLRARRSLEVRAPFSPRLRLP